MASIDPDMVPTVLFRAGSICCGVEATQVSHAARATTWLPTETIEARLALSPLPGRRYRLYLRGMGHLNVAAPLEWVELPAAVIYPLPALLTARPPLPGLRAFAQYAGQWVLLLDAGALANLDANPNGGQAPAAVAVTPAQSTDCSG